MKTFLNKTFTTAFLLLLSISGFAAPAPPAPNGPNGIGDPPPLPIDENLAILTLTASLFGIYSIYKHLQKSKTSI
ncbi:hypothetical protein [Flavobacterium aestivum]|uniref:hypothetical protein n=1 Tax=Flavobacterium aestivum TaxID=3003257 RepID=UPI0024830FF7|nr:hypothetical protein [Flavobacterium aestivum]